MKTKKMMTMTTMKMKEKMMTDKVIFGSMTEALQKLADVTGAKIRIAKSSDHDKKVQEWIERFTDSPPNLTDIPLGKRGGAKGNIEASLFEIDEKTNSHPRESSNVDKEKRPKVEFEWAVKDKNSGAKLYIWNYKNGPRYLGISNDDESDDFFDAMAEIDKWSYGHDGSPQSEALVRYLFDKDITEY